MFFLRVRSGVVRVHYCTDTTTVVSTVLVCRARVETGKSWRNETPTFWGLFRMALESRNETGN